MIKGILFDMDGTLVDSERHYCDGTYIWMKRAGYKGDKDKMYGIIGLSMPDTYIYLRPLLHDAYSLQEIRKFNEDYFGKEDVLDYTKYIYDDVKDVIYDLKKKGYKLALCSASDYSLINRFLKECAFEDIFDVVLSTEDTKEKPDPTIYLTAMERLGLDQSECLIVEDSPNGIKAAKSSGVFTLARINKYIKDKQTQADRLFDDLHDIYRYLGE